MAFILLKNVREKSSLTSLYLCVRVLEQRWHLREFGQAGIHGMPGLSTGSEYVHLRLIPAGVIQARRGDT